MLVGNMVKLFSRLFAGMAERIFPEKIRKQEPKSASETKPKYVITISREYGSGGREIGKKIAGG